MRLGCRLLLPSLVATLCYAQLTIDQKVSDFQALAALYAKRYGPYEWKRDALGVDLFSIAPWLAQVQATKNDLDFYEVMQQYVASLNDAHDVYQLAVQLPGKFELRGGYLRRQAVGGFDQPVAPARGRVRVRERLRAGFDRRAGFPKAVGWFVAIRNRRQPAEHQAPGGRTPDYPAAVYNAARRRCSGNLSRVVSPSGRRHGVLSHPVGQVGIAPDQCRPLHHTGFDRYD